MSPSIRQLAGQSRPNDGDKFRVSSRGETRFKIQNINPPITEGEYLIYNDNLEPKNRFTSKVHLARQDGKLIWVNSHENLFDEIIRRQNPQERE